MPSSFQRYARERAWSCGKELPGVAALGVVLADGAPGALAQVRAPLVPRVRGEEVVLGAAGRLGEAGVLGGRRRAGLGIVSPPGVECGQVEEVPGPGIERDVEPVAEVVAAALVASRRSRRRRAATPGRAGRPTAARRGRTPARRRGSRRRACAARRRASPRRRGSARCRCPSQPRRSPSCHSPSRKTASRERAEQPLVERAQRRCRAPRRAGGRGRPAGAPCRPSSCPSWTSRAPVWVSVVTAAARACSRRERRRRARLVVVLDEADEPLLVADVGRSGARAPTSAPSCTSRS